LELPRDAEAVQKELLKQRILAGLPLGVFDESLKNCLLVAVTEIRTKAQIDQFARLLRAAIA
ncbi:MAG: glycine dehydrogenase, partial [Nitrospirae bacterium]|nr:glycine dehydrogenase [Fimbriimonadaceae bacterium]